MSDKLPLIILTGPTAVGKTGLSIQLAKMIGGEIISADSMQVYKGMDIGTAKITDDEMQGVTHHLIDCIDPSDEFNVVIFQQMAKKAMTEIYKKGKIPIIVGGTGFYIQAILYDIDFNSDSDSSENECTDKTYRTMLYKLADEKGNSYVHDMLKKVDAKSAELIHENNLKRVVRALEYYNETGCPISAHNESQSSKESPYNFLYFVLNDERDTLYKRIDQRVDEMFDKGLLKEMENLISQGISKNMTSMQGIGYKELFGYFENEYDLERTKYLVKLDTRHFAKRQITWFKREKNVIWLNYPEFDNSKEKILDFMIKTINNRIKNGG